MAPFTAFFASLTAVVTAAPAASTAASTAAAASATGVGFSASSTCWAWASTSTASKTRTTRPSGPTRNEVRSVPVPHGVVPQTPYASCTAWSASVRSSKGSEYFAAKAACESVSSGEMPRTVTPAARRSAKPSRRLQASFVQPGVSSFG